MGRFKKFPLVLFWLLTLNLIACSNIETIENTSPDLISSEATVSFDDENPDIKTVRGPTISVRESFGKFTTALLLGGGAGFGSAVHLEGTRDNAGLWTLQAIASIQYTNLGGVYRRYDKAGIEGSPPLVLTTVDMEKQFTINSINMTETVSVTLPESLLKEKSSEGFTLIVADDSGNSEQLTVPASYVSGFLLALEK